MTGKVKTERKLYTITRISIWLGVLVLGLVSVGLSLYYDDNEWLEISVGLFSGAIISFVTSFTITVQDSKSDQEQHSKMLSLLNTIGLDIQNEDIPNGISVYQNNREDNLDINAMLQGAKSRIWILGTDLSNTLVRSGNQIVEACRQNKGMDLRILALHPQNLFVTTRYGEIGWSQASEMRQSVYEAQQSLSELEEKIKATCVDAKVDIRLYMSQPTVMLYIIDNNLVISHLVTGARTSDSLQLCCNLEICKKLGQDFVDKHFESVWTNAIPLEKALCRCDKESVYSISMNGDVTEYTVSCKRKILKHCHSTIQNALRSVAAFVQCHASPLSVPILSMLVGGVFMYITQSNGLFQISSAFKLNGYYTNAALGFISGGILTVIEYCLEIWFERMNGKRREALLEQEAEMIRKSLNDVFFKQKENEHGVYICEDRNSADIKGKILNAKSRVWIFATNHRYISSLDVHHYLKENAGDIDVRFLMLSPQSMFVATRFSEIQGKKDAADFANEISNNLMHLVNEYKDSLKVELRLYYRQPTFMMYLIDDTLIISHILRQGRARDQAHFIFDLNYPHIQMVANDYIRHFLAVWNESVKCKRMNSTFHPNGHYLTVKQGITADVEVARTTDYGDFTLKEENVSVY